MHHTIIGVHANCRSTKALVAYGAMPVLVHHDSAIQPPRLNPPVTPHGFAFAQYHGGFHCCLLYAPQPRDNALRVERRVGCADAPEEVGLEVANGEGRGDEVESGGGGEAGAMFGDEVERWGPVGFVRRGWCEVEGEKDVVDGGFCVFGCAEGGWQRCVL